MTPFQGFRNFNFILSSRIDPIVTHIYYLNDCSDYCYRLSEERTYLWFRRTLLLNSIADCLKRTSCKGSNICQGRQQRAIIYNDYMCTQDKLNSVLSFVQSNELIRLAAKSLELAIILIDSTICFILAW